MKNKKHTFQADETPEQKEARWAKQLKAAKSFAKVAGVDKKAIQREQRVNKFLKDSTYWYDD